MLSYISTRQRNSITSTLPSLVTHVNVNGNRLESDQVRYGQPLVAAMEDTPTVAANVYPDLPLRSWEMWVRVSDRRFRRRPMLPTIRDRNRTPCGDIGEMPFDRVAMVTPLVSPTVGRDRRSSRVVCHTYVCRTSNEACNRSIAAGFEKPIGLEIPATTFDGLHMGRRGCLERSSAGFRQGVSDRPRRQLENSKGIDRPGVVTAAVPPRLPA